ncbi:MAG: Hsp20/alpha crystallin family protein [Desulfobacterales bacterium]
MITRRFFDWPAFGGGGYFDELDRMRQQLDRMVREAAPQTFRGPGRGVFPLLNLTEDDNNYYLRAELPGIKTDDLEISATENNISINGERKLPEENESARFHRRERDFGQFSRAITLPGKIDNDKISANLTDGILTVTIPKAESAKPRQIEIK